MSAKVPDPYASGRDTVLRSVLDGPAETDSSLRRAAADGVGVPTELQALVDNIHRHAYRVTDEEIAALQTKYDDDQLFEIIVSAAVGAARRRLMAGLAALEQA